MLASRLPRGTATKVFDFEGIEPVTLACMGRVDGAAREDRTLDLSLTKGVLYH